MVDGVEPDDWTRCISNEPERPYGDIMALLPGMFVISARFRNSILFNDHVGLSAESARILLDDTEFAYSVNIMNA